MISPAYGTAARAFAASLGIDSGYREATWEFTLHSGQAERTALWKKIFIDVMADAPWVPIFNEQRFTVRSARMGGTPSAF